MSGMTMTMSMDMSSTATATATAAAATSTAASMDMSSMSMGDSSSCKISMLWNWYTVDSCFLASTWHVRSSGMFAGSCIGVILLTMSLEFLRRTVKEYDRYLIRKHNSALIAATITTSSKDSDSKDAGASAAPINPTARNSGGFRPTILEQAIRALLHMVQFAVAYFIMLLAMYFNGYIIICIFIGAYIGSFIFHWEYMDAGRGATSASQEPTVCCA
ncbi:Ctr copper transporter family-domain-containing protein [Rostrohypoxylon terebratum]|nr:Ctr copper transporter family-domain-containing protein [Rostrohypoxylon terebratum]